MDFILIALCEVELSNMFCLLSEHEHLFSQLLETPEMPELGTWVLLLNLPKPEGHLHQFDTSHQKVAPAFNDVSQDIAPLISFVHLHELHHCVDAQ